MLAMFATVGMVGVIGASAMTVMKGPVRGMQEITKRTVAENNMMASAKLAVMGATNQVNGGDCDDDGYIEPIMFDDAGANPKPLGGGYLPSAIGASLQDPWQTRYGYCVWDHGSLTMNGTCEESGVANRLEGADVNNQYALVVISAGPDRIFQTGCKPWVDADTDGQMDEELLDKVSGSDDIVYGYTYAEANSAGGGLWKIKGGEATTAEIGARDIEVAGSSGTDTAKIGFDADLGMSGVGKFMAIKADNIYASTPGSSVEFGSPLRIQGVDGLDAPAGGAGGGGTDTLGALICTTGQIAKWNGAAWGCAADAVSGGGAADNMGDHSAAQNLDMNANRIIDMANPTSAQDAATKAYTDAAIAAAVTATGAGPKSLQRFTAAGTYTRGAGVTRVLVICQGAGGGAGTKGSDSDSGSGKDGGKGGAGELRWGTFTPGATETVVAGTGGNGGGPGATGPNCQFGAHVTARGGTGGQRGGNGAGSPGAPGVTPVGSGGVLFPLIFNMGFGGVPNGGRGGDGVLIVIEF